MRVLFGLALLGFAASASAVAIASTTQASTTQAKQDEDITNRLALGAILENVGKRLQSQDTVRLPEGAAAVEETLYEELKDLPKVLEEEELAALMESAAEYGWLKKKWKKIRKGAKKAAGQIAKGVIISKVVGTVG